MINNISVKLQEITSSKQIHLRSKIQIRIVEILKIVYIYADAFLEKANEFYDLIYHFDRIF